jgi:TRAP-type C4-dicarboxylate transport system permease small subunit
MKSVYLLFLQRLDLALGKLCAFIAGFGGILLLSIALMTLSSVLGRALFSNPIQGDVELVQLACAVSIASFLPYTQFHKANIIVDFFTMQCSEKSKSWLDGFSALVVFFSMSLIAWRLLIGCIVIKENGETSMLIAIPLWMAYLLMLPGFFLTSIVALTQACQYFHIASIGEESSE